MMTRKLNAAGWGTILASLLLPLNSLVILSFESDLAAGEVKTGEPTSVDGWTAYAPRDEIRPSFSSDPHCGSNGTTCLVISASDREAVDGAWVKTVSVQGGRYYRFSARRKSEGLQTPRRSAIVKITWQDSNGRLVPGASDKARPEYPLDRTTDDEGWTELTDVYWVPQQATQAHIELHLRWTTAGSVRWRDVSLEPATGKPSRKVRLATVHFRPNGAATSAEKCAQFAPLIDEAGRQLADLVCLPESLTYYASRKTLAEVAEPIPGPSTKYFGQLAKKNNLYIVAGLTERAGSVVYNTAALLGPEGQLVGKYRKVCLPREEIKAGVTPGEEYPVFDTRFGKLGLMICWDVYFPEVARNLSNQGAEVIAMPIWGGSPLLASARAIENQIYLVTSTYSESESGMKSGVWDHEGKLLVEGGKEWGRVLVSDVDLDQRKHWWWLGDLKARIARERPAGGFQE